MAFVSRFHAVRRGDMHPGCMLRSARKQYEVLVAAVLASGRYPRTWGVDEALEETFPAAPEHAGKLFGLESTVRVANARGGVRAGWSQPPERLAQIRRKRLPAGASRRHHERIAGGSVQRVASQRGDLVLVGIQHGKAGRVRSRSPLREPHGSVVGVLQLRRIGAQLRLRVEREALIARIELPDYRLVHGRRGVREPDVVLDVGGRLVGLRAAVRN